MEDGIRVTRYPNDKAFFLIPIKRHHASCLYTQTAGGSDSQATKDLGHEELLASVFDFI